MDTMAERLREARKNAKFDTAQAAIDAFGWPAAAYRHHENGTRGFDVESAKRYGRAFKVNPGWLLALDTIKAPPAFKVEEEELEVRAVVQAGVWRADVELPPRERYKIKVGPPPFPGAERFAMRMEGGSMNLTVPEGYDLECLRVAYGAVEPKDGNLVIVERHNHDLVEMTCKRLRMVGDKWELWPESSLPEFQEPIVIGKPDPELFTDDEVRVVGIVLNSSKDHYQRR